MSQATERFQEAYRRHLQARAAASKMMTFIQAVTGSIRQYPHSFLGMNALASLPAEGGPGRRYNTSAKHPMEEWPNTQSLQNVLKEWGESLIALNEAYNGIPEGERVGLAKVPEQLTLD
jgi:hypothetical protein